MRGTDATMAPPFTASNIKSRKDFTRLCILFFSAIHNGRTWIFRSVSIHHSRPVSNVRRTLVDAETFGLQRPSSMFTPSAAHAISVDPLFSARDPAPQTVWPDRNAPPNHFGFVKTCFLHLPCGNDPNTNGENLRTALATVLRTNWWNNNTPPPDCDLDRFVYPTSTSYQCLFCMNLHRKYKTALACVRQHISFRPS
jgi:hypothetical protein